MYFILITEDDMAAAIPVEENILLQLQNLVEGYITIVHGSMEIIDADLNVGSIDVDIVANDEGLFEEDFGVNLLGSFIAKQTIVGPVVLTRSDPQGNTLGFTAKQVSEMGLIFAWDGVPDSLKAELAALKTV